jgi:hypothetical protein
MNDKRAEAPLVSIGVPIYNGQRHMRQALDSLLAQDYANIEVVINDNGSTDSTPEICREYVERDNRVRYHREETNRGLVPNFNRVFELSRGEFFMWHGVNDVRDPTCVRRCVEKLLASPDAVLCYTNQRGLDEDGNLTDEIAGEVYALSSDMPTRLYEVIHTSSYCEAVWGLIRSSAMRIAGPMRVNIGPDHVLLAALSTMGRFEYIPQTLHQLRWRGPETWPEFTSRTLTYVHPRVGSLHRRFPATKLVIDHFRDCWKAAPTLKDRLTAMRVLAASFPYVGTTHVRDEWPAFLLAPGRALAATRRKRGSSQSSHSTT